MTDKLDWQAIHDECFARKDCGCEHGCQVVIDAMGRAPETREGKFGDPGSSPGCLVSDDHPTRLLNG